MKIIISTCDKYRWLIPVFMYFYKKYWSDNPYQTDIVTEREHVDGSVFYTDGISWSSGILNYIKQSKEERFLLFLEDLPIRNTVNTKRVGHAKKLCNGSIGYVRVSNVPTKYFLAHSSNSHIKGFRYYSLGRRFSAGLQPAIYQKQYLLDFLRKDETPWQTEKNGAVRLQKLSHKWQGLWPESTIVRSQPPGLMKKGKLVGHILRSVRRELRNDATKESKAIYRILKDQIKK